MYIFNLPQNALFGWKDLSDLVPDDNKYKILSLSIDWVTLEKDLSVYYSPDFGAPSLPIRMMVGLQLIKYIDGLSDEQTIERCVNDVSYQYFIGRHSFKPEKPCDRSLMSVFRKRIGEEGCKRILAETVHINGKNAVDAVSKNLIIDSTVQEKYTAFPTDIKLALDSIFKMWNIGDKLGVKFRNKHKDEVIKLKKDAAFTKSNARTEIRQEILGKLRSIGLILLEELRTKLPKYIENMEDFMKYYDTLHKALTQQKDDKAKIYSIYEPQIYCIAKGKHHKKYEFGTKVSVVAGINNRLIYDIVSFDNNIHDSKSLNIVIENLNKTYKTTPQELICDQGYRVVKMIGNTKIITPIKGISKLNNDESRKILKKMNRRYDIEEIISHLKCDHRMGRNELQKKLGDHINPLLSASASNCMVHVRKKRLKLARQDKKVQAQVNPLDVKICSTRSFTRGVPFRKLTSRPVPNLFSNNI
jgi:IS5 family transposase